MTTDETWLKVYFVINLAFALGFLWLASFVRSNGKPPDPERAAKFSRAVVIGSSIAGIFGVKAILALVSGEALASSGRRGRRTWEWVTRENDYSEFMNTVLFDGGAALVCLVGAIGFLILMRVARNPELDPSRKMDIAVWVGMTMFWTFILTFEVVIYYQYG